MLVYVKYLLCILTSNMLCEAFSVRIINSAFVCHDAVTMPVYVCHGDLMWLGSNATILIHSSVGGAVLLYCCVYHR